MQYKKTSNCIVFIFLEYPDLTEYFYIIISWNFCILIWLIRINYTRINPIGNLRPRYDNYCNNLICNRIKTITKVLRYMKPMGLSDPWDEYYCNNWERTMPPITTVWIIVTLKEPTQSDLQHFTMDQPNYLVLLWKNLSRITK